MRRHTPGVVSGKHLLPALVERVERHDAERVVELLEPLVLERRAQKLRETIGKRLASVQVVFDAPHDPHNGAAVVRSCEAFGVQYVNVVERKEKFLLAPSVARGSEKWIDLRIWKSSADAIARMRDQDGLELVAAHPEGELAPEDLASIPRLGIVLGNERDGIAEDLLAACRRRVRVPMRGFVESLNVSVSAAILLSAATRNREGDLSRAEFMRVLARGLYFTVDRADEVLRDL
jgi:tRNA (guanosine-2'-O-)-methyltransferase